ncbi:MAG: hypothetical protein MZV65_54355 [Chromatiales bacterium]|nr:hypothetical protein [Chromatiales bacterium]
MRARTLLEAVRHRAAAGHRSTWRCCASTCERRLRAIRLATEFAGGLYARRGDELAVNAETEEIGQLQRSLNFASQPAQAASTDAVTESDRTAAGGARPHRSTASSRSASSGLIESCNAAAERIFGTGAEALLGRSADTVAAGLARAGARRPARDRGPARRRNGIPARPVAGRDVDRQPAPVRGDGARPERRPAASRY